VCGTIAQDRRPALLYDPPEIHHSDAVTEVFDNIEIVTDED